MIAFLYVYTIIRYLYYAIPAGDYSTMSTKRSVASVESIIKPNAHLLKELSLPQLCDHLYERNMIDKTLKEKIENATACEDSNRLYLDHLIANSNLKAVFPTAGGHFREAL